MTTEPPNEEQEKKMNLFKFKKIKNICKSRYFPLTLQTLTIMLFALILYDGFFGSQSPSENFAIIGVSLFFPIIIIISVVFFGRIWCAVCPIGALEAAFARIGLKKEFPLRFRKPALILSLIIYVFILWVFSKQFGVRSLPFNTALFFITMLFIVIVIGLLFKRRPFCLYICPITLPLNLYSRVSPFQLKGDINNCKTCPTKDCFNGNKAVEGCPMNLIGSKENMANCTTCMKCVKSCPNDSIKLYRRTFGSELLKINKNEFLESVTALILVGIFPLMMSYMTITGTFTDKPLQLFSRGLAFILNLPLDAKLIHISSSILWIFVALFFFGLASLIASKILNLPFKQTFSIFGPPFMLLALIGSIAHMIIYSILSSFGNTLMYLSSTIGIYFYHPPNLIDVGIIKTLSKINTFVNFSGASLLAASILYLIARKIDQKKALVATLPFIILLIFFLFLVYNQRFSQLGFPHLL